MYKVIRVDLANRQIVIVVDGDELIEANSHALMLDVSMSKLEIEQMCEKYAKEVLDRRELEAKFAKELSKIKIVPIKTEIEEDEAVPLEG